MHNYQRLESAYSTYHSNTEYSNVCLQFLVCAFDSSLMCLGFSLDLIDVTAFVVNSYKHPIVCMKRQQFRLNANAWIQLELYILP